MSYSLKSGQYRNAVASGRVDRSHPTLPPYGTDPISTRTLKSLDKSEWARHTWECVAPIHFCGHCPHPINHLRRRIHQPSLLPHNIHRNGCAVQQTEKLLPVVLSFAGVLRKPTFSERKTALRTRSNHENFS